MQFLWLLADYSGRLGLQHSPTTLQTVVKLLEGQHKPEMDNIWLQTKVDFLKGQQVGCGNEAQPLHTTRNSGNLLRIK